MSSTDPYAAAHQRALEYLDRLTPEESKRHLQRAGILDENGHLAKRYTSGGEPVDSVTEPLPARR